VPPCITERAILVVSREWTQQVEWQMHSARISDETYRRAVAAFGEQGLVELLGVNGYYVLVAALMNGARTAPAGAAFEALRRFPD